MADMQCDATGCNEPGTHIVVEFDMNYCEEHASQCWMLLGFADRIRDPNTINKIMAGIVLDGSMVKMPIDLLT